MTYKLTFLKSALKEWENLDHQIKAQFKKKLAERLENPVISKDKLSGLNDCYKIKLRNAGYRLVYKVIKDKITVQVVAVAKRDKSLVYDLARKRIDNI
ncbi:MAG: type II toxin-antitoxin system RelE/ParE family toxin [Rickettsiales bacterium]|jgi:mRNA interferase RelE/StbE|nr:type II toxin-antitoxin system RelE/ParE family toxin [Rickettsiales bacterium]